MKRFPAVLALVLVLVAGTAGMALADTLTFTVVDPGQLPAYAYIPPPGSPIASVTWMYWSDDGGGHLYCQNSYLDNIIYFANPTYVNSFQINGMPYASYGGGSTFGPMNIAAFNAAGGQVWSTPVDLIGDPPYDIPYTDWGNWLTVTVNTAAVSSIIFRVPNPGDDPDGYFFYPSIDNLVVKEAAAVPIPASVWLLASGLLALVGLRRKFTR